jgi:type III pantothenate kinase
MTLVVADIGNSRIKWGRSAEDRIDTYASLPSDDAKAWERQWQTWGLSGTTWAVASVVPRVRIRFMNWLEKKQHPVRLIDSYRNLPLDVALQHPERVGIDRLLNAVGANNRRPTGQAAIVVDAGSAITVDLVDATGAFRGGAILPGLRLMAKALNDYTAQLPLVDVRERRLPPGTETVAAIETGIFHAAIGGINCLIDEMPQDGAAVFCTGGDAALLAPHLRNPAAVWPEMTLEGIRVAALHSPKKRS